MSFDCESERNKAIEFLRFLFMIMIVIHHGMYFITEGGIRLYFGGYIGVEFFFIVAGYFMAKSYEGRNHDILLGKDIWDFIVKRYLSFLPNFYVGYFVILLIYYWGKPLIKIGYDLLANQVWNVLLVQMIGIGEMAPLIWYLSALLFAQAVVYLLIRILGKNFIYSSILLFLFGLGYLNKSYGSLGVVFETEYFIYGGLIRAIVDILGGAIIYYIIPRLTELKLKKVSRIFLSIIEWCCYLFALIFPSIYSYTQIDFSMLLMLMIAFSISVSNIGELDKALFKSKNYLWLGEYSFSLFLGHYGWSKILGNGVITTDAGKGSMILYISLSILTALVIMYVSRIITKSWKRHRENLANFLCSIREEREKIDDKNTRM